jgi:hypothetical protein
MVLLADEAQVVTRFSPIRVIANLSQDRRMVCAERTIGLGIVSDAPDGSPS